MENSEQILPTVIAHIHNDPHTKCPICGCEKVDKDVTVSQVEMDCENTHEHTVEYIKRCITCNDLYKLIETTPL